MADPDRYAQAQTDLRDARSSIVAAGVLLETVAPTDIPQTSLNEPEGWLLSAGVMINEALAEADAANQSPKVNGIVIAVQSVASSLSKITPPAGALSAIHQVQTILQSVLNSLGRANGILPPTTSTITATLSIITAAPTFSTLSETSTISKTSTASIATTTLANTPSGITTSISGTSSFAAPTSTATTVPTHTSTPHPNSGLKPGQKAGIAIGVILFAAICAAIFFLFRRRRKPHRSSRGISVQSAENWHSGPTDLGLPSSKAPVIGVQNTPSTLINEGAAVPWYEQPKDDEAMVRLFKEVDSRLTDHVLNFYVASDGETYGDEISTLPRDVRRSLERRIPRLEYLLGQGSRGFVLRAIIVDRVMKAVDEEIQVPVEVNRGVPLAPKHGVHAAAGPENGPHNYEFPAQPTLKIARTAHEETRAFAINNPKNDARLRSLEAIVKNAGDFAITMKRQPTRFEFIWPSSIYSSAAAFDPNTMEAAYRVPNEERSGIGAVQVAVFPGLQKLGGERGRKEERSILSKIQVLVY